MASYDLFPSCVPSYDFFSGGKPYTIWQSTTEKYGVIRAERRIEQEKIDFILANKLKDEHRLLMKYTYYEPWKFKGVEWFTKKHRWSKRKYYRVKEEVDKFIELLDKRESF